MEKKTVLITGGSGLVGTALTAGLLNRNYRVIHFTRKNLSPNPSPKEGGGIQSGVEKFYWNPAANEMDETALQQANFVVHLAGAGVAEKRWTASYKKEIFDSRVQSTSLLSKKIGEGNYPIEAIISASATGYYGLGSAESGEILLTEESNNGNDFLADVCMAWEKSWGKPNCRLVINRLGIVLSKKGGAYKAMSEPMKLGVAAIPANGKQWVSWIHITDLVNLIIAEIENKNYEGVYNAVAPTPVTQRTFTLALKNKVAKYALALPMPAFILKIIVGEMSTELLKSTKVSADKILKNGFVFQFGELEKALDQLKK